MSDIWEKGGPGQKIKLPDPRGVHHVKESPCACWRFGRRFGCCRLMVNCSELLLDEVDRLGVPFQRLDLLAPSLANALVKGSAPPPKASR